MRPTLAEIISGASRTLGNRAASMAMMNADNENYMEFAVAKVMLDFTEMKLDNEYGRLAKQNATLENLLNEAAAALKPVNDKEADRLANVVKDSHLEMSEFPSLSTLHDKNVDLRTGIQDFIIVHSEIPEGGSPELKEIRKKIWGFITDIIKTEYKEAAELFQWPV